MVELADAPDSKSGGAYTPCGFDSRLRHQFLSLQRFPILVKCNTFVTLGIFPIEFIERPYGGRDAFAHVVRIALRHLRSPVTQELLHPVEVEPVLHEPGGKKLGREGGSPFSWTPIKWDKLMAINKEVEQGAEADSWILRLPLAFCYTMD